MKRWQGQHSHTGRRKCSRRDLLHMHCRDGCSKHPRLPSNNALTLRICLESTKLKIGPSVWAQPADSRNWAIQTKRTRLGFLFLFFMPLQSPEGLPLQCELWQTCLPVIPTPNSFGDAIIAYMLILIKLCEVGVGGVGADVWSRLNIFPENWKRNVCNKGFLLDQINPKEVPQLMQVTVRVYTRTSHGQNIHPNESREPLSVFTMPPASLHFPAKWQ